MNEKKINILPLIIALSVAVIILMAIFLDIGTFLMVLMNLAGFSIGIGCLVFGYFEFDCDINDSIYLIVWGLILIIAVIFVDKLVMMW